MPWLTPLQDARSGFESLLGLRPELLDRYRDFYRTFWDDGLVSRRVLELCRLRIAAIHGSESEWAVRDAQVALSDETLAALRAGDLSSFDSLEQQALIVADKLPYRHQAISDADIAALETALSAPATVSLLTALAFFDVSCRLRLVLDVPGQHTELQDPPLQDNTLV